jgi:hypothetical protein
VSCLPSVPLSFTVVYHLFQAELLDIVDLARYTQLRTLVLEEAAVNERLLEFILRVDSPSLESVVLPPPGKNLALMDWAALDAFFTSDKFAQLRCVQIASALPEASDYLQENLPLLHLLGKLKLGRH